MPIAGYSPKTVSTEIALWPRNPNRSLRSLLFPRISRTLCSVFSSSCSTAECDRSSAPRCMVDRAVRSVPGGNSAATASNLHGRFVTFLGGRDPRESGIERIEANHQHRIVISLSMLRKCQRPPMGRKRRPKVRRKSRKNLPQAVPRTTDDFDAPTIARMSAFTSASALVNSIEPWLPTDPP